MRLMCALFAILTLALHGLAQTTKFQQPALKEGLNIVRPDNVTDPAFIQYAGQITTQMKEWEKSYPEKMKGNFFQIVIMPSDRFVGYALVRVARNYGSMTLQTPSEVSVNEIRQVSEFYVTPSKHPAHKVADLAGRRIDAMLAKKRLATTSH